MPKLGAPVDHKSGLRRSFFVLLVLILSSAFCIGLSAAAMADETATATPAHDEETQVEPTQTEQPNDWHPEEQEETPEHPEEEPDCDVEEAEGQTAAEDECEEEEDPEEDSDDDSDEDSEEDSDDDECEIPGVNDGGDDRADDDEDDEDCEVEAEEPEEPEEGDDTEVLGTTTNRPRLAQTAPGETSTLALYALAFLGAGVVMRVAGNRRIAFADTDKLLEQALRRNARYLARHR